jgi:hypothetical protein
MTDWPGTDFIKEMKAKVQSGSDAKTKILAFRAYIRMLNVSASDQNRSKIVDELIAAYAVAERVEEQKIVVGALGEYGNITALKFVEEKMADTALKAEAEVSLVSICEKLITKNPLAVKPILKELKDSKNQTVQKKAQELYKSVSQNNSPVQNWKVNGPYKAENKDGNALFEVQFAPEKDLNKGKWKDAHSLLDRNNIGIYDLSKLAKGDNQVAYLKTTISAENAVPFILGVGSDDGVNVWVNGQQVHANNTIRPAKIGQDKVNVFKK